MGQIEKGRHNILNRDGWIAALLGTNSNPHRERTAKHLCVSRRAMACWFSLRLPAEGRPATEAGLAALDEVERLEEKLSVYRTGSDISCLNRGASRSAVRVDEELFDCLQIAARLAGSTQGSFDFAAGALTRAWGFFVGPKRVPPETERREALAASGVRHIELDPTGRTVRYRRESVEINLGSIGKGYAIDRALDRVRSQFRAGCALMQGGQSSFKGIGAPRAEPRGWMVAIGDPYRPGRAVATAWLKNRALGTSSTAHQFFVEGGRRYGHVLDPRTGWPADKLASATAIAPTAAEADALSTAFFVMGVAPTRAYCERHPEVSAVLVTKPVPHGRPRVIVIGAGAQVNRS